MEDREHLPRGTPEGTQHYMELHHLVEVGREKPKPITGSPEEGCNAPLFVTLFKSYLVSQKWGLTKTFCANLWEYYFLLVCLDCYVDNVCLSCLFNSIVNQHNPCALVIMPLFMLLAIFPKPSSWPTLLFIQIIFIYPNKCQDLFLRQSFYQN
jgi:hypothetical protein